MTPIEIVYQDKWLVVVNKPARLPVHQTHDKLRPHLQGILETQLGCKLVLFHRLDVDTTGLVILGKDPTVNEPMTSMFRDRKIQKSYRAGVEGFWPESLTKIEGYIKKVAGGKWVFSPKGSATEYSLTEFRLLEKLNDRSLIEASPRTGRTHQIRLHCASQRHPILGDPIYGRRDPRGLSLALHAYKLQFVHPVTHEPLQLKAPVPENWEYWGLK